VRNRVTPLAKSAKDKVSEHVPGHHPQDPAGNGHGTIGDGSNLTTLN
jgi:hypothetical protein